MILLLDVYLGKKSLSLFSGNLIFPSLINKNDIEINFLCVIQDKNKYYLNKNRMHLFNLYLETRLLMHALSFNSQS